MQSGAGEQDGQAHRLEQHGLAAGVGAADHQGAGRALPRHLTEREIVGGDGQLLTGHAQGQQWVAQRLQIHDGVSNDIDRLTAIRRGQPGSRADHVEADEGVAIRAQGRRRREHRRRQRFQDAAALVPDPQLGDLEPVVQLDHRGRLDEDGLARARGVVHDAEPHGLERRAQGQDEAILAQGHEFVLKIRSEFLGMEDLIGLVARTRGKLVALAAQTAKLG